VIGGRLSYLSGVPLSHRIPQDMTPVLFACRDCGQIHRVPAPPLTNRWLLCRRCGRRLWRSPRRGLDHPFAYATGAIILFLIANGFALFEIGFAGDHRSGLIISGAVQLTRYDAGVAGVGRGIRSLENTEWL
jgi:uncharacterized paraquat-inducible protein A